MGEKCISRAIVQEMVKLSAASSKANSPVIECQSVILNDVFKGITQLSSDKAAPLPSSPLYSNLWDRHRLSKD